MASNIDQRRVGVNTDVANTQVVTPVTSTGPANLEALGKGFIDGYSNWTINKAYSDFEEETKTLDSNLNAIEQNVDMAEKLSAQLSAFSASNPHIKELVETTEKLGNGAKQRQQAKLLFTLRAEDALKKAVSRAPGLRPEIARIAGNTLGFDPSAATVKLLMRNIDDEWAALSKRGSEDKPDDSEHKKWFETGVTLGISGMSLGSTFEEKEKNIGPNKAAVMRVQNADAEVQRLEKALEEGEQVEDEYISALGSAFFTRYNASMDNTLQSILNFLPHAKESGHLEAFLTDLLPQLSTMEAQLDSSSATMISGSKLSAKGQERALKQVRDLYRDNVSAIKNIISTDDMTQFETRVRAAQALGQHWKLDFMQANETLSTLIESVPGAVPIVYDYVLSRNPKDFYKLNDLVKQAFSTASTEERQKMNLSAFLNTLTDAKVFDNLSQEQKASTLYTNLVTLRGANKRFLENPESLDKTTIRHFAASMAESLQLASQMPDQYWVETAELANSSLFMKMVETLREGDTNEQFQAEILSDAAIESSYRLIEKQFAGQVREAVEGYGSSGVKDVVFDMDTKSFSYTEPEIKDPRTIRRGSVALSGQGIHSYNPNKPAKVQADKAIRTYEQAKETLLKLKDSDPKMRNLTDEQIEYALLVPRLQRAGVKVVGTPPEMPESSLPEETKKAITQEEAYNELGRQVEKLKNLIPNLTSSPEIQEILQGLEEVTNLRRNQYVDLSDARDKAKELRRAGVSSE